VCSIHGLVFQSALACLSSRTRSTDRPSSSWLPQARAMAAMASRFLSFFTCGANHRSSGNCKGADAKGKQPEQPRLHNTLLGRHSLPSRDMPVDCSTKVPIDLYNSLLKASDRAKVRGEHTLTVTRPRLMRNNSSDISSRPSVRLVKTQSLELQARNAADERHRRWIPTTPERQCSEALSKSHDVNRDVDTFSI